MANLSASLYIRSKAGSRKPSKKLTNLSAGENYQLMWYEGKAKKSRNVGIFADVAQVAKINQEAELRRAAVAGSVPAPAPIEEKSTLPAPASETGRDFPEAVAL